jgi:hypothetical protein
LAQDEWYDPAFLEQLVGTAVRVVIQPGATEELRLRVSR